jgi:HPt (histidine-containing phosphotransfer) domain-containing protein
MILIVANENNVLIRNIIPSDWDVIFCDTSFEVLQLLKKGIKASILIIDEKSVPLDAYQTINYIKKEIRQDIPAVILCETINSVNDTLTDAAFFIEKPFNESHIPLINKLHKEYNEERKSKPQLYSLDYLKQVSDNNNDFIIETLIIFNSSVEEKIKELKIALIDKDYDKIAQIAHNIKPSFEMLENKNAVNICSLLNHNATEADLPKLVKDLVSEFSEMIIQIKKDFPELKMQ